MKYMESAQSHVDNSFGNSITFTQNNILGTHVLLEAAKIANINLFLHISTDEVYGEAAYEDNVEEKVVLIPTNPYAASKAAAEFIVKSYRTSFNLPTIITRSNNIYGPHQYPEKIIPKFICRLLEGKKCCIHGDGSNKRNYLYVKDVAEAYDTIVHSGKIGSIYNIGSEFECSNLDVAKYLIKLIIYNNDDPNLDDDSINYDDHIEYVVDRNVNDKRYAINSEKLKKEMGWSNSVEWINGLKDTIAWYKENRNNWDSYQNALDPHPGNGSTIFSYHNNDNNDNNDDDVMMDEENDFEKFLIDGINYTSFLSIPDMQSLAEINQTRCITCYDLQNVDAKIVLGYSLGNDFNHLLERCKSSYDELYNLFSGYLS
eukprot:TRINITY_DN481_c0_g5_i3.p1 TRINITY_DN481_c0_g5~~TRINITY_DN481_c0_g5_i3.p1  ORF type:complete len:372 (+),score=95.84 TRINITY_DN481_c0_g5_i3:415-1530(+)